MRAESTEETRSQPVWHASPTLSAGERVRRPVRVCGQKEIRMMNKGNKTTLLVTDARRDRRGADCPVRVRSRYGVRECGCERERQGSERSRRRQ